MRRKPTQDSQDETLVHVAQRSTSTEFDRDSIAIRTGLYHIDAASGHKIAVLICSKEQRTYPHRPYFVESEVVEDENALIFCPRCGKTHDTTSLMEAFQDGWLDVQAQAFDEDPIGFLIDPRVLVSDEIRRLRDWNRGGGAAERAGKIRRVS